MAAINPSNYTKTIRISRADYNTLHSGGTIVRGGVTYSWDNNALYLIQDTSISLDNIQATVTDVVVPN
jgi:uncharacterized protein (UPF0333 family)